VPKSNSDKDTNEDIVEDKLESSDVHLGKYFCIIIKLLFLFKSQLHFNR